MTTSKYELDLRPALIQYERKEITLSQFAALVAIPLDELSRWATICGEEDHARSLQALWQRFDFISSDSTSTIDELDDALEELYDWADAPSSFDSTGQPQRGQILCRVRNAIEG
jgi:hypothetical protein